MAEKHLLAKMAALELKDKKKSSEIRKLRERVTSLVMWEIISKKVSKTLI
jgi:hypothetical protein